ncbi:MAG: low molecular weight phosphotyrosine protein phosphatase [Gammaproteobacteria bacterium]|nr:low molecular weight phosphotyrosine protein phosphatase [Gammaproteobacteria bacterium]
MVRKILFVCLGNICRSPAAEGIMNTLIKQNRLGNNIACDSAGVTDWNVGSSPDSRMKYHAGQRGYRLSGSARQFNPTVDFHAFDYIITMDTKVDADIRALTPNADDLSKVHPMTDFCREISANEVPDPYYGTTDGFERVLDILEDACAGLIEHVAKK